MQSKSKQTAFLTRPVVVGLLAMLCCMLWGSAFPCVKIGYRLFGIAGDHTPSLLLFAGLRFTLAGLLALCIGSIGARRWLIPKPTSWPMILKLGLVQTVTQYIFFYIGVAHASGVKSSIIVSANVFFSILISAIALRQERMTAAKLLGCIAGFAGVVLINTRGGALDFSMQWNGEGFVLISSLAYAISSVMVKQYAKRESPVTLSGYQFVWGGLVLIAVGLIGGGRICPTSPAAFLLLGHLGMLSAVAYSLWAVLLQHNPVSRVSIYGFMNPVCGVFLSALLLGEQGVFGPAAGIALVLVCVGIFLVNRSVSQTES